MRIGIDARMFNEGLGIGRYIAKLLTHLEDIEGSHTILVFLTKRNWDAYHPNDKRFVKVCVDIHWYSFAEQCIMPLVLLAYRLDLVHFPHINVPLLYPRRFVVTIHDLILLKHPLSATSASSTRHPITHQIKYWCYRFVIATAVRRATHIIAVSQSTKDDIVSFFGQKSEKIAVILEGADPLPSSETCTILERYAGCTFFFRAGNAYPHKNVEGLLRAFRELHSLYPDVQLLLCGQEDFFQRRIVALIQEMKLGPAVVHLGSVSDACLSWLYSHATAYVFPSFEEGFGLPAIEAFLAECPVLAADIPVLREVCGTAALYFDPSSSHELVESMKRILTHPTLRTTLMQEGRIRAQLYSWARLAEETLVVYTRSVHS